MCHYVREPNLNGLGSLRVGIAFDFEVAFRKGIARILIHIYGAPAIVTRGQLARWANCISIQERVVQIAYAEAL